LHHTLLSQRIFFVKASAFSRWEGILLSKLQKIKKLTTTIKKIGLNDLKWNFSKCNSFKNLKQNYDETTI
jgi:hypothetical protein